MKSKTNTLSLHTLKTKPLDSLAAKPDPSTQTSRTPKPSLPSVLPENRSSEELMPQGVSTPQTKRKAPPDAPQERTPKKPKVHSSSMKDMLQYYGGLQKCMAHWIIGSSCTLIRGPRGMGKTSLALGLELGYLRGEWMDYEVPSNVLGGNIVHYAPQFCYTQFENVHGQSLSDEEASRVYFPFVGEGASRQYSFPLDKQGRSSVEKCCEAYKPRLIVFDDLCESIPKDKTSSSFIKKFVSFAKDLALRHKACVILLERTPDPDSSDACHILKIKRLIASNCSSIWSLGNCPETNSTPSERRITLVKSEAGPAGHTMRYNLTGPYQDILQKVNDTWMESGLHIYTLQKDISSRPAPEESSEPTPKSAQSSRKDIEQFILGCLKNEGAPLNNERLTEMAQQRWSVASLSNAKNSLLEQDKICKQKIGRKMYYSLQSPPPVRADALSDFNSKLRKG